MIYNRHARELANAQRAVLYVDFLRARPDQTREGNRGCNQNAAPDVWAANVGWWDEVFRPGPTSTTRHDASVPYHRMR